MILDSDYETLTVMDHGKLRILNLNDYNLLKFNSPYYGERIQEKITDDLEVIETYNYGIFNIRYKNHRKQLRNYNEVSKRLRYCLENKVTEPLTELLLEDLRKEIDEKTLREFLEPFKDRIEFKDKLIIIDDMFSVDQNGQAYILDDTEQKPLCIVAHNDTQMNHMVKTDLGNFNLSFQTIEIYLKVLFLLFPNKNDNVFINQLPKGIRDKVEGQ